MSRLINADKMIEHLDLCLAESDSSTLIVDATLAAIKYYVENAPTVDAVDVETLMHIFGDDEPCNFNGWDDRTDDWCAEYCERHLPIECWRHAIQQKWWERRTDA